MTQPSPEAVEAVTRIVQQGLQGVTEPLVARLVQVMTEDRSQTTPTTAGMLTSGGASQAFPAISAIGGTPSGGSIPPTGSIPGLTSFNPVGGGGVLV